MTTKRGLLFAAAMAVVAVLYQVEVVTTRWQAEDHALISSEPAKLWKFLSNTDSVDKWFQWVSHLRAVDSRPMGRGKRFEAIYDLPLIGEYALDLVVVEYTPQSRLVLESQSLLKPRFTLLIEQQGDHAKLSLSLQYRRNSALFRVTLGPVLWLLTAQQLRHSLFLVKMLFPA